MFGENELLGPPRPSLFEPATGRRKKDEERKFLKWKRRTSAELLKWFEEWRAAGDQGCKGGKYHIYKVAWERGRAFTNHVYKPPADGVLRSMAVLDIDERGWVQLGPPITLDWAAVTWWPKKGVYDIS